MIFIMKGILVTVALTVKTGMDEVSLIKPLKILFHKITVIMLATTYCKFLFCYFYIFPFLLMVFAIITVKRWLLNNNVCVGDAR